MREGGSLPESHRTSNGILILYNVDRSYAGKYTCFGINKRNEVLFSKTVNLRIIGRFELEITSGVDFNIQL